MVISILFFAILNGFLALKYKDAFIFKAIVLSLNPLTFGFILAGIGIWMVAFKPHWSWISIVLGTFWGMWIFPILLPKLSVKLEAEIMHPKTALGRWFVGALIGMGGIGGAASGRLASKAAEGGNNWPTIILGLSMISFAFILQYAFIHQAWSGYLGSQKAEEKK